MKRIRTFIIIAALVLLCINIYLSISGVKINYFAIASNILLIIAMLVSRKQSRKENAKT